MDRRSSSFGTGLHPLAGGPTPAVGKPNIFPADDVGFNQSSQFIGEGIGQVPAAEGLLQMPPAWGRRREQHYRDETAKGNRGHWGDAFAKKGTPEYDAYTKEHDSLNAYREQLGTGERAWGRDEHGKNIIETDWANELRRRMPKQAKRNKREQKKTERAELQRTRAIMRADGRNPKTGEYTERLLKRSIAIQKGIMEGRAI